MTDISVCQVTEEEATEATWIITTVILITTAGGRLAQERRGASCPPDRKEWLAVLRTKFTMKCQSQSRCQSN